MTIDQAIAAWEVVGSVPVEALREARLPAWWAARIAGAVGEGSARMPLGDFGHIALTLEAGGWAVGSETAGGLRAGAHLEGLALGVLGGGGDLRSRIDLPGLTVAEAASALGRALGLATAPVPSSVEIDEHPLAHGAPFAAPPAAASAELARWFRNGDRFVRAVAKANPSASPARIWPHHFDLATSIDLGKDAAGEARSIGFGLSPGDSYYPEPYFYASPWPVVADTDLDPLDGGGHWHRQDFVSAVLPGRALGVGAGEQVAAYLRSALLACRRALGVV
jgi:hypothetical protein